MRTLRAIEIFNNATHKLIAIEAVDFQSNLVNKGYHLHGTLEPVAIIICTPEGINTLDMFAQPTAIAPLRQNIPELDALITAFKP